MVGTTMAWVMRLVGARRGPTRRRRTAGRYTIRRPLKMPDRIAAMPAMWYGGTLTSAASSSSAPMNSTVDEHVGREVAVAQQRRLRLAGRAAGEQPDGDVVGVGDGRRRRRRRPPPPAASNSVLAHHRHAVDAGDAAHLGVVGHHQRRRQPGQHRPQAIVGQAVVHRRRRAARRCRCRTAPAAAATELTSTKPTRSAPDALNTAAVRRARSSSSS